MMIGRISGEIIILYKQLNFTIYEIFWDIVFKFCIHLFPKNLLSCRNHRYRTAVANSCHIYWTIFYCNTAIVEATETVCTPEKVNRHKVKAHLLIRTDFLEQMRLFCENFRKQSLYLNSHWLCQLTSWTLNCNVAF